MKFAFADECGGGNELKKQKSHEAKGDFPRGGKDVR